MSRPEPRRRYDAPLASRVERPPADAARRDPFGPASSVVDEPTRTAIGDRIEFAHNGFDVDSDQRFRPQVAPTAHESAGAGSAEFNGIDHADGVDRGHRSALNGGLDTGAPESQPWPVDDRSFDELSFEELWSGLSARRHMAEGEVAPNRHHRTDSDDSGGSGRHFYPD
ncbi:MAG: hypothetical protein WA317_15400 [Mycobacterium sp.]|uniref:hypothetical protein n=1 Tax=Mycobacterium sp. TaxID=1785 RepID=UPI003CC581C2